MHTTNAKRAKRNLFISLMLAMLLMLVATTLPRIGSASPDPRPKLAAPTITDVTLMPGSTFTVNITVADVEKLWGFQFVLFYDTSVLTIVDSTDFGAYAPFTQEWPSDLNETGGYMYMAFTMPFAEKTGVTTVDPKPIAWIKFLVDEKGASTLDLSDTALIDVKGAPIPHDADDGLFANVPSKISVFPKMRTAAIGEAFSVDITVADVENLWGYEFVLRYNTTILNATSYSSYEPFTVEGSPPEINETSGYVFMNYSMPIGEPEGFTTVDPKTVAKISFVVNRNGSTLLKIKNSTLVNVHGDFLPHQVVDGFFSNIHDIAITGASAVPSLVSAGEPVTVSVTIANKGDLVESFNVTARYDSTVIRTKEVINLVPRAAPATVTFNWDTSQVPEGSYIVTVEATLSLDVRPGDNRENAGSVRIRGGAYGNVNFMYALAVGVAVSFGAMVGIHRFKAKKSRLH